MATEPIQEHRIRRAVVRRVAATASERGLLSRGDRVLVAVSGGPDSVALLALLLELAPRFGLRLSACHIHHGLRGMEADEDAAFVEGLCRTLDVSFHLEQAPPAAASGRRGKRSLQERAREARYQALERAADALEMTTIAVGHTADDQAETVLLWMLRGAGLTGLAGIPPARQGRVVRPLLGLRRAHLQAYLRERGLLFRTDSTNAKPVYLRNRIRHELLPVLQAYNPDIVQTLCRQADLLREDDRYLAEHAAACLRGLVRETGGRLLVEHEPLTTQPLAIQRRAVRLLLRQASPQGTWPTFRMVSQVLSLMARGRSGTRLVLPGLCVARDYRTTALEPLAEGSSEGAERPQPLVLPPEGLSLPVPGSVTWPLTRDRISIRWESPDPREAPSSSPSRAVLDADRFTPELRLRTWAPGDLFHPAGMKGHRKKLQDYFSDLKIPRRQRHRIPLLVAPEGILWVVGYRASQRFCATAATTRPLVGEVRPETR